MKRMVSYWNRPPFLEVFKKCKAVALGNSAGLMVGLSDLGGIFSALKFPLFCDFLPKEKLMLDFLLYIWLARTSHIPRDAHEDTDLCQRCADPPLHCPGAALLPPARPGDHVPCPPLLS